MGIERRKCWGERIMGEFYRNCDCSAWKRNCEIIDSAILMQGLRGGPKLEDSFFYCPWCGELLKGDAVHERY